LHRSTVANKKGSAHRRPTKRIAKMTIPSSRPDDKPKTTMVGLPSPHISLRLLRRDPARYLQRLCLWLRDSYREIARQRATSTTDGIRTWCHRCRRLPRSLRPGPIRNRDEAALWIRIMRIKLDPVADELAPRPYSGLVYAIAVTEDDTLDRLEEMAEIFGGAPDANARLRALGQQSSQAEFEALCEIADAAHRAGDHTRAKAARTQACRLGYRVSLEKLCRPGALEALQTKLSELRASQRRRRRRRCRDLSEERALVDQIWLTELQLGPAELFRIVVLDHNRPGELGDDRPRPVPEISARELIRRTKVDECRGPPRRSGKRAILPVMRCRPEAALQTSPNSDFENGESGR
jgi:hypothetical protein